MNWLKYSNLYITLNFNPLHWQWIPRWERFYNTEWPQGPQEREYRVVWLGVLVKLIIDNGAW